MKKKYLLLAIFLFLFIPKDTFALTQAMVPDTIMIFDENSVLTTREAQVFQSNTWEFNGTSITSSISRLLYRYQALGNIQVGVSYDINFVIRQPNINVAALNSYNGGKPIVMANDTTCSVNYSSSSSSIATTFSPLFSVECRNVYFDNTRGLDVNVLTPFLSHKDGLYNNLYGISYYIGYNETQHSQEITSALDKNTEEVKKQTEAVKEQTEATKKQTDTIKDSDTSGSKDSASGFFSGFESDDYGLSDIIIMPLDFIKGLSSSKCSNLHLPLPLVNKTVELPCMTSIYSKYFGPFLTLYQTITTGIIAYWCCVNILKLVQGFKNPDSDEIEVMDL